MKITSNNIMKLEELYKHLRRDGEEDITLEKVPIENAMGFDIILNIDINVTNIIVDLATTYLEYRLIKGIFLQKYSGKKEPIDVEILKDSKKLENLKVDEPTTTLYIEYQNR